VPHSYPLALGGAIAALLISLPSLAAGATKPPQTETLAAPAEPQPGGPAPTGIAAPKELESALRAIVEGSPIAGARAGILVVAIDSGQVLYAHDADVLLNPASNVKLVTTAAALARLGPEYRFSTEFLVDGASAGSQSPKALFVRGRGDPSIVTERLWAIAGELEHLGIRKIGELVLDDGFFDGERHGPGFDQESGDRSYLAPTGALSLNFNSIAVHVGPGDRAGQRARVELEPASDFFEVENRTVTVPASGRRRVKVSSVEIGGGRQRIVVEGRVPAASRPQAIWRKIDEPALYFGSTLKKLLELRGVKVGRIRAGAVAEGAKLVYVSESDALAEVVRRLNKTSNNFTAEQLLETLGAEVKGAPGTWPKGVAAVEEFLAEMGIPRGSYVMKNGSGLNDTNRFSARQLVTLLRAMWVRFPLQAEYLASLPVAGRDGTIRWRMEGTEAAGRLRAKTGTLEGVTSLSGYVENAGKQAIAFSILVNDYPGRSTNVVRAVDALGGALAASGGPPGGLGAAVALAKGKDLRTPPTASPADLAQAAHTYYALGRGGDPRHEPFLRTALRAEADPALKLAIAESVYLSDTEGETARRTFLDAIASDGQALFRLWSALAGDAPPPVLPSLADLAAEGNGDALAKLVELAPTGAQDGKLAGAISDALAAVAASAPAELVAALHAAPQTASDAALGALGAGIARSEEKDHPFPAALRALAQKEGEASAYANALLPRLDEAIAAGKAARAAPALVPAAAPTSAAP
jgi:D-alanyl-D-alanine carboxypeptidase/D-alanyl-D-alanine-endopeptidase (penicillin-binding protein 4)